MSKRCFICGEDNSVVLHEHHIVPRRYDGSDDEENLVTLCANCHEAVEKIYDQSFYKRLGVDDESDVNERFDEIVGIVRKFVIERVKCDSTATTKTAAVYGEFERFARERGFHPVPQKPRFGRALRKCERLDVQHRRVRENGDRVSVYDGVALRD